MTQEKITVKVLWRQLALPQEKLTHAPGVSFATVNCWVNGMTVPSKLAQLQLEHFCVQENKQGKLV